MVETKYDRRICKVGAVDIIQGQIYGLSKPAE